MPAGAHEVEEDPTEGRGLAFGGSMVSRMGGSLGEWQRNQARMRAQRARWIDIHWWARLIAVFGRIAAGTLVLSLIMVSVSNSSVNLGISVADAVPFLLLGSVVWIGAEALWHIAKRKTGAID